MKYQLLLLLPILISSCAGEPNKSTPVVEKDDLEKLPEVVNVSNLNYTDFVATTDNDISGHKNYIYSPTMLFAWNEIKRKLKEVYLLGADGGTDLYLLDGSQNYKDALQEGEYEIEVTINDDTTIKAHSEFNMELVFEPNLEDFQYPIRFNDSGVKAFGMSIWDERIASLCEIIYYKDDDNFIFKLKPKDNKDELIFIKGLNSEKASTFNEILKTYTDKKAVGVTEKTNEKLKANYLLEDGESFTIPMLRFNIRKDYNTLTHESFMSKEIIYTISSAWQRNALLLNHKGAKIESEAEMEATAAAEDAPPPPEEVKIIQHLTLNKTFFLIVKHTGEENPYFCIKIDNTELMEKYVY